MAHVRIIDTTLRDGQQSLWGMQMRAGMALPVTPLIDRVGLKGERRGGARISEVHANFFVNEGGATAQDVVWLIDQARRRVSDTFGIELREEIVRLGDFTPD